MNLWKGINIVGIAFILVISGCDLIKMKEEPAEEGEKVDPIARVGDQYLYPHDLEGISTVGMSIEDSTERTMRFVNNWIKKQLLIKEASTKIEFDEADIERKVLDYRYSLMGYEYQSYFINQNLNVDVSDEEIELYYKDNIDNFLLKQNIIRGKYIKIPIGAPKINKVKTLINSTNKESMEELKTYALSFAATYQLNDSVWMVFDDVIKNSPLAEIPNKIQFLQQNRYIETADAQFQYFLKIDEYRISDNISPLEFVKEVIKNIIINKRKVQLAQQLEDDVYKRATKNKEFEIY
ncbi:MAG TPA: peptidylprolyl isomerase [Fulvivirga sp.]|nr:peptidylprolyl isomerase [Fulvivirga sp.]